MHLLLVVAAFAGCLALVFAGTALFVTRLRTGWAEALAAEGVVTALLALSVQATVHFVVPNALAETGNLSLTAVGWLRLFDLASVCVLGWGLTVAATILHVGKPWVWKAIALFYIGTAFYMLNIVWFHPPHDIGANHWRVFLGDAAITRDHPEWARAMTAVYALPVLASSYSLLKPPGTKPLRTFRLRAISSGLFIIAMFGFLGMAMGAADRPDWSLWGLLVSTAGASAMLLGYRPPKWVRARLEPEKKAAQTWPGLHDQSIQ